MSIERAPREESNDTKIKDRTRLCAEMQTSEYRKIIGGKDHFWGGKFENTNDKSFERARRAKSNETKIIAIGRCWTKLENIFYGSAIP